MQNTNNNGLKSQADDFPPGRYRKIAMTKVRQNLDGNGTNRGILIQHPDTLQERWVSVDSRNEACKMPFGSTIYYAGHDNRPSLTVSKPEQQIADSISQQIGSEAIDDQLLEQISLVLANAVNLASSLNPQLGEESITKLAISASITYYKLKEDSPF